MTHATLVDQLYYHASTHAERVAYRFLADGDTKETSITFAELAQRAHGIAKHLEAITDPGDRVLLLYPSGLDFVYAFFGCLLCNVIAVPAYPPQSRGEHHTRINQLIGDSAPRVILCDTDNADLLNPDNTDNAYQTGDCLIHNTDIIPFAEVTTRECTRRPQPSDLALLQYTSGSTAEPKGVMVSHGNLSANLHALEQHFGHHDKTIMVTWCPLYHDMGLIIGLLQGIFSGFTTVFFSPFHFIRQPALWLQALSRYQATLTCGPHFAYVLAQQRITAEQKSSLDLSHLAYAINAAEAVHHDEVNDFCHAFAECGLSQHALCPSYGLAEATVGVSFHHGQRNYHVHQPEPGPHQRQHVSCGPVIAKHRACIVADRRPLDSGEIGEIWFSGPSVAQGYWNNSAATQRDFHAYLADGQGPFLRTGDLGFIKDNELYWCGRSKDVIIIRGQNYWPHDIELTCQRAHTAIRNGAVVSFSYGEKTTEQLAIVCELRTTLDKKSQSDVIHAIRAAVHHHCQLSVNDIVLLAKKQLHKTTSGKIQRQRTKQEFMLQTLNAECHWNKNQSPPLAHINEATSTAATPTNQAHAAVLQCISNTLALPRDHLSSATPIASLAIDSLQAVTLSQHIERKLTLSISPTAWFSHDTLGDLLDHLKKNQTVPQALPLYSVQWTQQDYAKPYAPPPSHALALNLNPSLGAALSTSLSPMTLHSDTVDGKQLSANSLAQQLNHLPPLSMILVASPVMMSAELSATAIQSHLQYDYLLMTSVLQWQQRYHPDSRLVLLTVDVEDSHNKLSLGHYAARAIAVNANIEFPQARCQHIRLAAQPTPALTTTLLHALAINPDEQHLRAYATHYTTPRLQPTVRASGAPDILPTACYLVIGGCGGLGNVSAEWLIKQGARHLVLCGRSQPQDNIALTIQSWRDAGITVDMVIADITQPDEVHQLFSHLHTCPPLRGIIHAAGQTQYTPYSQLEWDNSQAILLTKSISCWLLHHHTQHLDLDFFLCHSSIATLLGSKRLQHYITANCFLEEFCHERIQQGLPTQILNWGLWADVGMATHDPALQRLVDKFPEHYITNAMAQLALTHAFQQHDQILVAPPSYVDFLSAFIPSPHPALLSHHLQHRASHATTSNTSAAAAAIPATPAAIATVCENMLKKLLNVPAIDHHKPLSHYGLNSITAVNLAEQLRVELQQPVTATIALEHGTIAALSQALLPPPAPIIPSPTPNHHQHHDDIAIIGMHCVLNNGIHSPELFWQALVEGIDGIAAPPDDRHHDLRDFLAEANQSHLTTSRAGYLNNIDSFDHAFFHISPREAKLIDPQHRLLLEVVYHAIEHSGIPADLLRGSTTGTFVGTGFPDFLQLAMNNDTIVKTEPHNSTGVAQSCAAGRISHYFGLHGPSLSVETACSSSFSALHQAKQSLQRGECNLAITAGANLFVSVNTAISASKANLLSPRARCHSFDDDADGYARAEGVVAFILKRRRDAERDNNNIMAVIRGSATNHNGPSSGITVPSATAQQQLIRAALSDAQLQPHHIDAIEAHGTGTPLGDPIEASAISAVYSNDPQRHAPLLLGSVKSLVGHHEAASGLVSLMKSILSLQHNALPNNHFFKTLNRYITLDPRYVKVNNQHHSWSPQVTPRRMGVSSFGYSGSNVHVIVESAPTAVEPNSNSHNNTTTLPALLTLSAKHPDALNAIRQQLHSTLTQHAPSTAALAKLCASSQHHQAHYSYRYSVVVIDPDTVIQQLSQPVSHTSNALTPEASWHPCVDPVASEQQHQWLMATVADYRDIYHMLSDSLSHALNGSGESNPSVTVLCQQFALFQYWQHGGIQFTIVIHVPSHPIFTYLFCGAIDFIAAARLLSSGHTRAVVDSLNNPSTTSIPIQSINGINLTLADLGKAASPAPLNSGPVIAPPLITDMAALYQQLKVFYLGGQHLHWQDILPVHHTRSPLLPLYPFQRQRHWLDLAHTDSNAPSQLASTSSHFYQWQWQPEDSTPHTPAITAAQKWLIVAHCPELLRQWQRYFHNQDTDTVITVLHHDDASAYADFDWVLPATDRYAHRQLFNSLDPDANPLCLYFPTVNANTPIERQQRHQAKVALTLVQSLIDTPATHLPKAITFVTQHALHPSPDLQLGTDSVWGIGRAAQNEHPELHCYLIDTHFPLSPTTSKTRLLDFMGSALSKKDNQFILTADTTLVARIRPYKVLATTPKPASPPYHPDRTYVITGASGGIGRLMTQHLLNHGARSLALLSRRAPTDGPGSASSPAPQCNATVRHFAVDISDADALGACLTRVEAEQGLIDGVFHTAAVIDDNTIPNTTMASIDTVFAAKVSGAWHLSEWFGTRPLRYFVLFSSTSILNGNHGQSNYVAANHCLATLAQLRQQRGLTALTVHWGAWRDTGMSAISRRHEDAHYLTSTTALTLMQQAFDNTNQPDHLIITQRHPLEKYFRSTNNPIFSLLFTQNVAASSIVDLATVSHDALEKKLAQQLKVTLGLSETQRINHQHAFSSLGMDSLFTIEFMHAIRQHQHIEVTATALQHNNTITRLAEHLFSEQQQQQQLTPPRPSLPHSREAQPENNRATQACFTIDHTAFKKYFTRAHYQLLRQSSKTQDLISTCSTYLRRFFDSSYDLDYHFYRTFHSYKAVNSFFRQSDQNTALFYNAFVQLIQDLPRPCILSSLHFNWNISGLVYALRYDIKQPQRQLDHLVFVFSRNHELKHERFIGIQPQIIYIPPETMFGHNHDLSYLDQIHQAIADNKTIFFFPDIIQVNQLNRRYVQLPFLNHHITLNTSWLEIARQRHTPIASFYAVRDINKVRLHCSVPLLPKSTDSLEQLMQHHFTPLITLCEQFHYQYFALNSIAWLYNNPNNAPSD